MKLTIDKAKLSEIMREWASAQPFKGIPEVKIVNKRTGVEVEITYIESFNDTCDQDTCGPDLDCDAQDCPAEPEDTCGDDEISTEPVQEA